MDNLLGRTVDEAIAILHEEGITPNITMTYAPRQQSRQGTERIVRVNEDGTELVAAVFPDPFSQND